jgi:tryptophan-rich sensory protein
MIFVSVGLLLVSVLVGRKLILRTTRAGTAPINLALAVAAIRALFYSPTFVGVHLAFAPTVVAIPFWFIGGIGVVPALQFSLSAAFVFIGSLLWSFWQTRKSLPSAHV